MGTNSRVVERIMRLGIEHRTGVPTEALWDLATKQLAVDDKQAQRVKSNFKSVEDWFRKMQNASACAYAFVKSNNSAGVVQFTELPSREMFAFVGRVTPSMPQFARL